MFKANRGKKITVGVGIVSLIAILLFINFKNVTLASNEVFKDIDFVSENAKIDGHIMDIVENVDEPERFSLSDEDVSIVLNTLKNAKFKAIKREKVSFTDVDYHINITLNKRYELQLDTKNQILIFKEDVDSGNGELYFKLTNDNNFFKLIDELVKTALTIQ